MPRQRIIPNTIEEAVEKIIPFLDYTSNTVDKAIYFDGWEGLAASAVLRAIAKDPPSSLMSKFNKIIHVDCSRWKSRRSLQRTIAQELKLPHWVMDILDRQDEEDDFRGVDEDSRAEIRDVGTAINGALREHKCLVVFINGSENTIALTDFGIPQPLDPWSVFGSKVLWTFRGILRLKSKISEKVDISHFFLYDTHSIYGWNYLLEKEAREIAGYTYKLGEAVKECCMYLLSLNSQGGNIMDYNWANHASSYWVCDGIIQGQADEAWELAADLHQQIQMDDYLSNALPSFGTKLKTPHWILARDDSLVHPESTSYFLAAVTSRSDTPLRPLPNDMFHQSDRLRVLKLYRCTFSFSSPPFHCCRSLRFLGLDGCKDQQVEEVDKQDRPEMEFFKSLWVLDICYTDWELDLYPEIIKQMAANIREVHTKKGRFWHMHFAWRQLQNLLKLRVIEPTCPWERGEMDEFIDIVKMELLDLSGNNTIQVLPSLSGATSLKTLVLDGCVGLEHVGPEGLPPSLESFSLDACTRGDQNNEAKISRISLAGRARLSNFRVCGSLPNLEEIDLSGTLVKTLVLKDRLVQATSLQKIVLLGCLQLHAILWPENGFPKLTVLHINSLVCHAQLEFHQAYATVMDIRFLQTLVLGRANKFCWKSTRFHFNLCVPGTTRVEEESYKKEKTSPGASSQICMPPPKSLIPNCSNTYTEVAIDNIAIDHYHNKSSVQFEPSDNHVEISNGISNTTMESQEGIMAVIFLMNNVESLHVHGNSSITTIIDKQMIYISRRHLFWRCLKRCHVVRCRKMHTVFSTDYFPELENFWAADLLMAHCIWSKRSTDNIEDFVSFAKLQSIHLYSCPRLTFVLSLSWDAPESYFPNLEILHIVNCGDLKDVFPVEPECLRTIATEQRKGALKFPNLKQIYLHELYKLQNICEVKMFAPKLEKVRLRGCWGLRRLPAVGQNSRTVVECEKDWWEKLEWDGMEASHDPSLFEPRHSSYYKKPLPRVSVLR